MPQSFDQKRVAAETFVRFIEHHHTLPSTNDLAMRLAPDPRTETPRLILADQQTAGRGRGSNRWWSGPGSLTFTLLIDTEDFSLPSALWPCVALAAGLTVCDILPQLVPSATSGLKWPNDVWLDGRKVCGILVEVPACRTPVPSRLVVGVGLNVNNSLTAAPADIRQRATSLCDAAGRQFDLTEVLVAFLQQLERNLADLGQSPDPAPGLVARWQERCVLKGRTVTIDTAGTLVSRVCAGLQPDGSLGLSTPDGITRIYGGVVAEIL
jgi:BirA family biotin operon repressor/biotin-[acetyl-CoA-carboxylase] ligase